MQYIKSHCGMKLNENGITDTLSFSSFQDWSSEVVLSSFSLCVPRVSLPWSVVLSCPLLFNPLSPVSCYLQKKTTLKKTLSTLVCVQSLSHQCCQDCIFVKSRLQLDCCLFFGPVSKSTVSFPFQIMLPFTPWVNFWLNNPPTHPDPLNQN